MASWKITISVDRQLCIGAAACVGTAPHLFQLDEDNIAFLKDAANGGEPSELTLTVTDQEKQVINEAAESCPTGAISVVKAK